MFPDEPQLEKAKRLLAVYMQSNDAAEWQKAESDLLMVLEHIVKSGNYPGTSTRLLIRIMYDAMQMEGVEAHSFNLMAKMLERL